MKNEIETESPLPDDSEFTYYWDIFIDDVSKRDNVKRGHLEHLTILCKLHKEFDKLTDLISDEGYTYSVDGRNGSQIKINPSVQIRDKVISEIRQFGKQLGLVLMKDVVTGGKKEKEKDEWE